MPSCSRNSERESIPLKFIDKMPLLLSTDIRFLLGFFTLIFKYVTHIVVDLYVHYLINCYVMCNWQK